MGHDHGLRRAGAPYAVMIRVRRPGCGRGCFGPSAVVYARRLIVTEPFRVNLQRGASRGVFQSGRARWSPALRPGATAAGPKPPVIKIGAELRPAGGYPAA